MVRSVHEVARCSKMGVHSRRNILMSVKLWYPVILWSWRWWISQLVLYFLLVIFHFNIWLLITILVSLENWVKYWSEVFIGTSCGYFCGSLHNAASGSGCTLLSGRIIYYWWQDVEVNCHDLIELLSWHFWKGNLVRDSWWICIRCLLYTRL